MKSYSEVYKVFQEIFESAADKRRENVSKAIPVLVKWALNFEMGKYKAYPEDSWITVKPWEYEILTSLFRGAKWDFLESKIYPSSVNPVTGYWDFDPPPSFTESRVAMEIQIQQEQYKRELAMGEMEEKERKAMVDRLANKIRAGLTVEKEKEDKNVGMMVGGVLGGKQRAGISTGVNLSDYQSITISRDRTVQAIQSQYNQSLANMQSNLYPNQLQAQVDNAYIQNQLQSVAEQQQQFQEYSIQVYEALSSAKVNARKILKNPEEATATKEPPVETNPLTTAPRMIEI